MGYGIFRRYPLKRILQNLGWMSASGVAPVTPTITSVSPSHGSQYGRTTVTITGTNFIGATLTFSAYSPISYSIDSATTITAIVGFGYGSVNITITNGTGSVTLNNAFTFDESVYYQILTAIKYGLSKIKTYSGYNYSIYGVYNPDISIDRMASYPSINIEEGDEQCLNTAQSHLQICGNNSVVRNQFTVYLDCVMQSTENPRTARNDLLQDVQKYFGNNWMIPDSSGNATAVKSEYLGCDPWGVYDMKQLTGMTITYRIWYKQLQNDPCTQDVNF